MPVLLKLVLYIAAVTGGEAVILFWLNGHTAELGLEFGAVMVLGTIFVTCRKCGKPIFERAVENKWFGAWRPWPEVTCSRCGAAHFGKLPHS